MATEKSTAVPRNHGRDQGRGGQRAGAPAPAAVARRCQRAGPSCVFTGVSVNFRERGPCLDTSRPSSVHRLAAALTGTVLLGFAGLASAGPPASISVQLATPGFYTSFSTGPQWAPYYAYPAVPLVPVHGPPMVMPGYYAYGPPPGYWQAPRAQYRRPGWGGGWRGGDDDDHHDHHHGGHH